MCRLHNERPGSVDRAAGHTGASGFFDGQGFAGDHGLVNRPMAVDDLAIDRDLLTWPDPQLVARLYIREIDILFAAIVSNPARSSRGKLQQCTNGS